MEFIDWNDTYNCGIKEIDNQHRGLFDLISKLHDTKSVYENDKYFIATYNLFAKFARIHFATEERYMLDAEYSNFIAHKKSHDNFLIKLEKFTNDLSEPTQEIHSTILNFLKEWYIEHILRMDRDYIESLQKKGFK